jgi:THAP4-like, heme-binding beta-barrel domain
VSTEPASGAARPGAPDSAPSPSPPSPSAPGPSAPGPGGPELHPLLAPLRFLIGRWEGAGVVGYPTIESSNFGQEISFGHNGKPYLYYVSRSWALEQDGTIGRPLAMETGFWRPQEDGVLEVVLAHSSGITEIYLGEVTGTKIEMATDAVVRTASAKDVTAGRRLYGLIGLDLGYAYDMAAMGYPLQSHLSAQLKRVSL